MNSETRAGSRSKSGGGERIDWRREAAIASLLGLLVALVVLWEPILHVGGRTIGPWDQLWNAPQAEESAEGARAGLSEGGDALRQFVPWARFAREELSAGRAPLWNSACGTGVPLLANLQSALLSPFTWPYYVLPLKLALIAAVASRLLALTAGMYLLQRSLARSPLASAFGAFACGFAGFHLMYPLHPHVAVHAMLPFALFAIDRAAHAFDRSPERLPLGWLALLSVSLGVMVLAGHPESLLFTVTFAVLFSAYRLARLAWLSRADRARSSRVRRFAVAVVAAGITGGLLGAVQWLPFLEYLAHSASLALGERIGGSLTATQVLLQLVPDALGTEYAGLFPGFDEGNGFYVGGLTTVLAVGAILFASRSADARFFLALATMLALYLFDFPLVAPILGVLFGEGFVLATRSNPIWIVSACSLAAFTLDEMRAGGWRRSAVIASGALVLFAGFAVIEGRLAPTPGDGGPEILRHGRVAVIVIAYVVGLAAVSVLAWSTRSAVRAPAVIALLGAVAVQSTIAFGPCLVTVDDHVVEPISQEFPRLSEALGGERLAVLSAAGLRANANLYCGIALTTSYDALEVREIDELRSILSGHRGYGAVTARASSRMLDLFGVRYVATRGEWVPIDTLHTDLGARDAQARWLLNAEMGLPRKPRFIELDRERPRANRTFIAPRNGLDGVVVHFLDDAAALEARVTLELRDAARDVVVATRDVKLGELRRVPRDRRECVLAFEPLANSRGKGYELEARLDGEFGGLVQMFSRSGGGEARGVPGAEEGDSDEGERARGRFLLDASFGRGEFEPAGEFGGLRLHRYRSGRGRAWIATRSIDPGDHERAKLLVLAAEFDSKNEVVLEGVPEMPRRDGNFELESLRDEPASASFRARCDAPAFLVLAQPHFSGWIARIDGAEAPLLTANYAFCAVALPQGECVVEIDYEPRSVRIGAAASLAACVALAIALLVARRA